MIACAGRVRRKLAELLQREFPECGGQAVIWDAQKITAATGWYRTSRHHGNDSYRWNAFAIFKRTGNTAYAIGSYDTMTECLKAGCLVMHSDGEISAKHRENKHV